MDDGRRRRYECWKIEAHNGRNNVKLDKEEDASLSNITNLTRRNCSALHFLWAFLTKAIIILILHLHHIIIQCSVTEAVVMLSVCSYTIPSLLDGLGTKGWWYQDDMRYDDHDPSLASSPQQQRRRRSKEQQTCLVSEEVGRRKASHQLLNHL